jgi:hypothetical protein
MARGDRAGRGIAGEVDMARDGGVEVDPAVADERVTAAASTGFDSDAASNSVSGVAGTPARAWPSACAVTVAPSSHAQLAPGTAASASHGRNRNAGDARLAAPAPLVMAPAVAPIRSVRRVVVIVMRRS